jgi:hypothetical protein
LLRLEIDNDLSGLCLKPRYVTFALFRHLAERLRGGVICGGGSQAAAHLNTAPHMGDKLITLHGGPMTALG